MFRMSAFRIAAFAAVAAWASTATAEVNKKMGFTKPINEQDTTVTVEVEPGPMSPSSSRLERARSGSGT